MCGQKPCPAKAKGTDFEYLSPVSVSLWISVIPVTACTSLTLLLQANAVCSHSWALYCHSLRSYIQCSLLSFDVFFQKIKVVSVWNNW